MEQSEKTKKFVGQVESLRRLPPAHKANVSHEVRHRTGIKIELKEKVNTLTESYIKSLLRRSKIYNPTKQQIEEKRQQVIILRQRKAPKKISPRTKNIAA